jgi:hypothetical protein
MKLFDKILDHPYISGIIIAVLFLLLVGGCQELVSKSNDGPRGDGRTTCLNCGKESVYDLGYCKSCYRSFMDFTYGNKD